MRISEIRIENLRGYKDQVIPLNDYTCLVGPNGAGKSTVLCALCIFFRDTEHFVTDLHNLQPEDFHRLATDRPIRVTVTFDGLSPDAEQDFREYVRHGKLVITAEAKFDAATRTAEVRQFGQRLVMKEFCTYFAADNDRKPAAYLKERYQEIRAEFPELPDESVKQRMFDALRKYEDDHPEKCVLWPSADQFYGFSGGANRLAKYVQWVYIPAVKDASTEQTETKSSALGKLLARSVRSRINFSEQIAAIKREVTDKYLALIADNQGVLQALSDSLGARLREYAHVDARVQLKWQGVPERAIRVDEPMAQIVAGEGGFDGELARFGHGLQRCYLLALLQELTVSGSESGPRLILGCDEPELHQHPPQARHLGDVLTRLSERNSQVIVSTHSPYLIAGDRFTDIRLVRKDLRTQSATVTHVAMEALAKTIADARAGDGKKARPSVPAVATLNAATLKMQQALLPSLNEMFFTRVVVLVEGQEDIAYITAYAHLLGALPEFRLQGCHLIAADRKSRMVHPLAIAKHLSIPTFAVFDADSTVAVAHRHQHENDNRAILALRGYPDQPPMPADTFWSRDTVMWSTDIGETVAREFGEGAKRVKEQVRSHYGHDGGLEKSTAFISDCISEAWIAGLRSPSLQKLVESIVKYAKEPWSEG